MSNIKIPNFVDYFQQDIRLIWVNRTFFILVFFLSSHSFSFDGILIILLRCSSGISSATSCSKSSSLTESSQLEVKLVVIVLLFVRKFHWGLFLIIFLLHCWMSLLVSHRYHRFHCHQYLLLLWPWLWHLLPSSSLSFHTNLPHLVLRMHPSR